MFGDTDLYTLIANDWNKSVCDSSNIRKFELEVCFLTISLEYYSVIDYSTVFVFSEV